LQADDPTGGLNGVTKAEMKLVTPVHLRGRRATVASKSNQVKLIGHVWLSKLDTGIIAAAMFPLRVQDVPMHYLLTGPMSAAQLLVVHQCLRVRRSAVRELLDWFVLHNPLYAGVKTLTGMAEMERRLLELPADGILPSMLHHVDAGPSHKAPDAEEKKDAESDGGAPEEEKKDAESDGGAQEEEEEKKDAESDGGANAFGPAGGMAGDNTGTGLTYVTSIGVDGATSANYGHLLGQAAAAEDDTVPGMHIRSSSTLVKGYQPHTLEKAFPGLFPFCRGGPSEPRTVQCSMVESIAHLSRISTGAFQCTEFQLVAYDLTECQKSARAALVTCKQKGSNGRQKGELYANLSADELRMLGVYKDMCARASKSKRAMPKLPRELTSKGITMQFLESMEYCAGKMRHTEEFGRDARKRLRAIMAEESRPSLFVTVNPDDTGSLLIHMLRGGSRDTAIPPFTVRASYLTHFPGASALAFERFLEVLVQIIIGWDEVSMSSTKEGGLFGHPRAFFMAIEEQGRLSLHDHILIWLHGHDRLRERLLQEDGVAQMQAYLDGAIQTCLPVPEDRESQMRTCASTSGCRAPLGQHPFNFNQAKKYNHGMDDAPLILQCTAEAPLPRHTVDADRVADRVLASWWEDVFPGVGVPTTPDEINDLKWGGRHNDSTGEALELLTCVLVRRTCWHKAKHMQTCSKSAKARRTKLCRARLPGDLLDMSTMEILHPGCTHIRLKLAAMTDEQLDAVTWNLDDCCDECGAKTLVSFMLRKTAGSAWMPQVNTILTRVFGCNNNVQYVYNCLLAFYIGMYASKGSKENTDSYSKAVAAYEKMATKQNALDAENKALIEAGLVPDLADVLTDFQKGLRRLHSAWGAHTRTEQVGAPRAAFFNLGHDGWIASRQTVTLAPNMAVAFLCDEPLYNVVNWKGTKTPKILDYVYRPEALEHLSWLEYVRDYKRAVMPQGETDRVMEFMGDYHPDHPAIGVAERACFLYPQVSAKSMPDWNTIVNEPIAVEERALYAKNALTLTVPFRSLADFGLPEHDPLHPLTQKHWWAAWVKVRAARESKVTAYGQRFLDIAQEYYTQVLCNKRRTDIDIPFKDEMDKMDANDQDAGAGLDDDELNRMMQNACDKQPEVPKTMDFDKSRPFQRNVPVQLDKVAVKKLCSEIRGRMKTSEKGIELCGPGPRNVQDISEVRGNEPEVRTMVSHVLQSVLVADVLTAITDVQVHATTSSGAGPKQEFKMLNAVRPSLAEVIRHYKFDRDQAEVFTMMATVFLCRLCLLCVLTQAEHKQVHAVMDPLLSHPERDQMFHVLLGAGGTGKSHVIKGIQNLAYCWGAARSLVLCGTSGIAGCLIGGKTIHNCLDIHIKCKPSKAPKPEQKDRWQWVVLGICDEVSMMSGAWLQAMHVRGQQLFDNTPEGFFGGRDWMFAGDFNQLGCVGTDVFTKPGEWFKDSDGNEPSQWTKDGCALWNRYATSVSHLKSSHRHSQADPLLKKVLHAMNTRTMVPELMDEFNEAIACRPSRPMRPDSLLVTPENKSKEHILREIYNADARNAPARAPGQTWKDRGLLLIKMSVVPRSNKTNMREAPMKEKLASLVRIAHRKELKYLPGEVGIQLAGTHCERSNKGPDDDPCHCCGCYTITETVQAQMGAVKSMWVKCLDVELKPDATVTWDEERQTHVVYAVDVDAVIVKLLLGPASKMQLYDGLPVGVMAIPPLQKPVHVSLNGVPKKICAGVMQLPMISSRCLTGHKMQGMTVPSVQLFDCQRSGVSDRQWMYVACSRVPHIDGIRSHEKLRTDSKYWNQPSFKLDHEQARLFLAEMDTTMRLMKARNEAPPEALVHARLAQFKVVKAALSRREIHFTKGERQISGSYMEVLAGRAAACGVGWRGPRKRTPATPGTPQRPNAARQYSPRKRPRPVGSAPAAEPKRLALRASRRLFASSPPTAGAAGVATIDQEQAASRAASKRPRPGNAALGTPAAKKVAASYKQLDAERAADLEEPNYDAAEDYCEYEDDVRENDTGDQDEPDCNRCGRSIAPAQLQHACRKCDVYFHIGCGLTCSCEPSATSRTFAEAVAAAANQVHSPPSHTHTHTHTHKHSVCLQ
jgi:hypothetical protein